MCARRSNDACPPTRLPNWACIARPRSRCAVARHQRCGQIMAISSEIAVLDRQFIACTPRARPVAGWPQRSEEHTSELQSLMRISYAVFCLKKKKKNNTNYHTERKLK